MRETDWDVKDAEMVIVRTLATTGVPLIEALEYEQLWVERRDDGLHLCDPNGDHPLAAEDIYNGQLASAVREWLEATE